MKRYLYPVVAVGFLLCMVFALVKEAQTESQKGYSAITLDASSNRVYAVNEDEEGVDVVDIKTGATINTILAKREIGALALDEQRKILAAAEVIGILGT